MNRTRRIIIPRVCVSIASEQNLPSSKTKSLIAVTGAQRNWTINAGGDYDRRRAPRLRQLNGQQRGHSAWGPPAHPPAVFGRRKCGRSAAAGVCLGRLYLQSVRADLRQRRLPASAHALPSRQQFAGSMGRQQSTCCCFWHHHDHRKHDPRQREQFAGKFLRFNSRAEQ